MKVNNLESSHGKKVANQFSIYDEESNTGYFQSYSSVIVKIDYNTNKVYLDTKKWNYSRTTAKYRNSWLGETTKETEAKIASGEYQLINLNG